MHSIAEAAKILGVYRQSIYRTLDCPELAGHIHDTEKRKCIDTEGIEILRGLLGLSADSSRTVHGQRKDKAWTGMDSSQTVHEQSEQSTDKHGQTDGQISNAYINSLEEQLLYLKSLITEKDKQIDNLARLTEQGQILLRQEQEKNRLLLEAAQAPQEAPKRVCF